MTKMLCSLMLCTALFACSSMPLNDIWHDNISALDYMRLLEIVFDVIAPLHEQHEADIAAQNAAKVRWWYTGTVLAFRTGHAILNDLTPRDLQTQEALSRYYGR